MPGMCLGPVKYGNPDLHIGGLSFILEDPLKRQRLNEKTRTPLYSITEVSSHQFCSLNKGFALVENPESSQR